MSDAQTIETENAGTEVAILGTVTALTVFGTDGGVDAILEKIVARARSVETDISTPAGRREVASLAYRVARSKTALDAMGKDLVADWKARSTAVDAERRRIRDALDALADEVRKPLTDWENADKARIAAHEAAIYELQESIGFYENGYSTSEDFRVRLAFLQNLPPRDWQEFAKRAADTLAEEIAKTQTALALTIDMEAAAAEADRLAREEAEAAAAREAERQRQREALAAENARREAEAKAAAEAAAKARHDEAVAKALANAERRKQEALQRERAEAQARAEHAEAEVAKAQADRKAREAQVDIERSLAAERSARAAQEAAERAAAAERQRIADEHAAIEAETSRREANKKHRQTINNEALADLVAATGIADATARAVITAIVSGQVRHIRIAY